MITAQDIREKTFEKATFGGYDMGEVDDFLEELAADLAASQKETGVLKGKMKVLVDKIEEYRSTEEAMQMALVSAQKVAKEIQDDAQAKADALVADAQGRADELLSAAQAKADGITGDLQAKRAAEEQRYDAAKTASASYIEKMLMVCQKQNDFLTALKDMEMPAGGAVVTPAPAEKKAFPQPVFDDAPQAEAEPEPEYVRDFENAALSDGTAAPQEPLPDEAAGIPEADDAVDEPTRMFRF